VSLEQGDTGGLTCPRPSAPTYLSRCLRRRRSCPPEVRRAARRVAAGPSLSSPPFSPLEVHLFRPFTLLARLGGLDRRSAPRGRPDPRERRPDLRTPDCFPAGPAGGSRRGRGRSRARGSTRLWRRPARSSGPAAESTPLVAGSVTSTAGSALAAGCGGAGPWAVGRLRWAAWVRPRSTRICSARLHRPAALCSSDSTRQGVAAVVGGLWDGYDGGVRCPRKFPYRCVLRGRPRRAWWRLVAAGTNVRLGARWFLGGDPLSRA